MRDRKQIREAIDGVTADTGGWDAPPTWGQIADVLGALLAPVVPPAEERLPIRMMGEEAPDALRERAIRAVAEGDNIALHLAQEFAADPRSMTHRMVAAVERALRDEREKGVQQGRRDAEGATLDDDTLRLLAESEFGDDGKVITTLGAIRALLLDETRAAEAATVLREEDERAAVNRLLDIVGLTGMEEAPIAEIVAWARAFSREEPAPAGVLAVVESATEAHTIAGETFRVLVDPLWLSASIPDRVTVAVLTGPLAGIVEAHRALTECEHMNGVIQGGAVLWCIDCGAFQPWSNGPAGRWQSPRLAAAVKPIK